MKLLVIGGGISGLISAHVFKSRGWDVKIVESKKIGGEFASGGLKYVHQTDSMIDMLDELCVPYSLYQVRGGIHLRGDVIPYPQCLSDMPSSESDRIQSDHYLKTRKTEQDEWGERSMNDPAAISPKKAMKTNFEDLIETLGVRSTIIKGEVTKIDHERKVAFVRSGNERSYVEYDAAVVTIPLWIVKNISTFRVPEVAAMRLNIAQILPRIDDYAGYDYVYTPYTPANVVHRISPYEGGYCCEANGVIDRVELNSDLNFLFPHGYVLDWVREGLQGHLLPLEFQPEWPESVRPIGRFAKWEPRSTMDVALADAIKLADEWS
jgi:hypothetical protein